jgi:phage-related minor tail protein
VPSFTIDIEARLASFQESLQKIGRDTQGIADKISRQFGGLESVFTRLSGVLAGAFSVTAAINFGRAISQSVIEAERSAAQLNATLRATGYAAGRSREQLEGLINDLSAGTVFDDDPIREGIATLLRFRGVAREVFDDAARAAVDLAAATGKQLPEAFGAIGRALQDPENGMKTLREAGVRLTDGQKDLVAQLIKTGDVAGAQKVVLDELAKSVGGSAGAENTGLYGATKSLAKAWDDLLRNIGQLPAVAGSSQGAVQNLTRLLNLANRATAQEPSPLGNNIRVPGVSGRPRIGQLSESEALALQNIGGPKINIAEPKSAEEKKDLYAEGSSRQARRLVDIYTDQWQELYRQRKQILDEATKQQKELEDAKIELLQEGPTVAEEQATKMQQFLESTTTGQVRALQERGRQLVQALNLDLITDGEYDAELQKVRDQIAKLQLEASGAFPKISDDGEKAFRRLQGSIERWGDATADEIADMVKTGTFEFGKLVDVILSDLARLTLQQTITRPLFSALAESLKGVSLFGGGGSSSSSGASGTPFGFSFGGNKASGGPVLGGNWYNVGENGPERLYMPRGTSGTIVPNGGGITYQQTVVIQSPTDGAVIRAAVVSGAAMARSEIARMGRIGAMS